MDRLKTGEVIGEERIKRRVGGCTGWLRRIRRAVKLIHVEALSETAPVAAGAVSF
jgi:hypothetical protein